MTNLHALSAGIHFLLNSTEAALVIDHEGAKVVLHYDTRGPNHDFYFEFILVMWNGKELDFNSVDDARGWIDSELGLDVDGGFDPMREWGLPGYF